MYSDLLLTATTHLSPQPKLAVFHVEEPLPRARGRGRRGKAALRPAPRQPRRDARPSGDAPAGRRSPSPGAGPGDDDASASSAGAAAADSGPQARRSRPRYVRLRHRPAREAFTPRPSPQRRSGAPPRPSQRDNSDSRAGASPCRRKRPRDESGSPSPCPTPPEPPAPPEASQEEEDAPSPDAPSSPQRGPRADAPSSSWRRGRGQGTTRWNHAPGSRWAKRRQERAAEHQAAVAAGAVPDPNRVTGPQAVGQACPGCDGRQHYALRCKRKMCGTCCRQHTDGPCEYHKAAP